MNKLGIHAFVWTGSSRQKDLERAVESSHDLGYKLIEFPRLDPNAFDIPALARLLQARDMSAAVTMGVPKGSDISSEDAEEVKRGAVFLHEAVAIARDLGAQKLGGVLYSVAGKYNHPPTMTGWNNSAAVIGEVAAAAEAAGVEIVLEVINRFETNLLNTTSQGLKFIEDTGSSNVKLHLDTFHMNIEEASLPGAIRAARDKIGYIHISESNRGYLGAGTINFDIVFDALLEVDYQNWMTFESFSAQVADEDLSITAAIWRNMWDDNAALARHAKIFIEGRYQAAQRRRNTTRAA